MLIINTHKHNTSQKQTCAHTHTQSYMHRHTHICSSTHAQANKNNVKKPYIVFTGPWQWSQFSND